MKFTDLKRFSYKWGISLILLAGSTLSAQIQADDVYKWVDENNETQYTHLPPPHGTQAIRIQSAPPPSTAAKAVARVAEPEVAPGPPTDTPADGGIEGEEPSKEAQITRSIEENCANARSNLAALSRSGRVKFLTPTGEVLNLSEEDRTQRKAAAKAQIKLICKN